MGDNAGKNLIGQMIADHSLETMLGSEDGELVFLARHHKTRAFSTARILQDKDRGRSDFFFRRWHRLQTLDHPCLLDIRTTGWLAGHACALTEYFPGARIEDMAKGNPLPLDRAMHITLAVLSAVNAMHAIEVIHGGVRPDRALEGADGRIVLVPPFMPASSTMDGVITGSKLRGIHFMPPEQVMSRKDLSALSKRSDIYSIGTLLYFMVTGQRPFDAPSPAVTRRKVLREKVVPAAVLRPDLPREIQSVLIKAMAKLPEQRYSNCGAMCDDLTRCISGVTPRAHTEPTPMMSVDLAPVSPSHFVPAASLERTAVRAMRARKAISNRLPPSGEFSVSTNSRSDSSRSPSKDHAILLVLILLTGTLLLITVTWMLLRAL